MKSEDSVYTNTLPRDTMKHVVVAIPREEAKTWDNREGRVHVLHMVWYANPIKEAALDDLYIELSEDEDFRLEDVDFVLRVADDATSKELREELIAQEEQGYEL